MANDLQARFNRLRIATADHPPTATSAFSFYHDIEGQDRTSEFGGRGPGDPGQDQHPGGRLLSITAAPSDARRSAWEGLEGKDDPAPSSPIDVPTISSPIDLQCLPEDVLPLQSRYVEPSPLETFLRSRRPSITFNPQVTLESGQRRALEERLPRLGVDTRVRVRPIVQDLARHSSRSPLVRAQSEAERSHYDSVTGLPLGTLTRPIHSEPNVASAANQPRCAAAQTTIDAPDSDKEPADLERGASLTSDSTASSGLSDIKTPTDDTMDCLVSPISPFSPFYHSTSLPEAKIKTSSWPILQRQACVPRAKSYSFNRNRNDSIRSTHRQGSRRSTASSMSPATAFLSRFAREERSIAPDDEGQEVGEYVLGRQIGFGGFSVVREAFTIENGVRVCRAVKIVRRHITNKDDAENERVQADFEREVDLWRCLSHQHILSLIAVHVTNLATFCFTKISTGGTLFDMVRANRQGLHPTLARRYAFQLASAVRYLHEDMRIVHRDVKLENCLIDYSAGDRRDGYGDLLLCDFGLAEFEINDGWRNPSGSCDEAAAPSSSVDSGPAEVTVHVPGSLQYTPPELLLSGTEVLHRATDVWAFGVVVFALVVGSLPFQHAFQPRVKTMILAGEWSAEALRKAEGVADAADDVVELVSGCLCTPRQDRWTVGQVLSSRWLRRADGAADGMGEKWKL